MGTGTGWSWVCDWSQGFQDGVGMGTEGQRVWECLLHFQITRINIKVL